MPPVFRPRNLLIALTLLVVAAIAIGLRVARPDKHPVEAPHKKLYWFVPDGFRADPTQFDIFEWAEKGELPNLAALMKRGCYGFSRPVFPGHTPTNFATLMTGTLPLTHGIADGAMRIEGSPLNVVVAGGFSSFAKKVPPIWVQLEGQGSRVTLQSIPGSTPPELFLGNTIKGRWGAWGLDLPSVIYQDRGDSSMAAEMGLERRLFSSSTELTHFDVAKIPAQWPSTRVDAGAIAGLYEVDLSRFGNTLYGLAFEAADHKTGKPDHLALSSDRKSISTVLAIGQWSEWLPIKLSYAKKTLKASDAGAGDSAPIELDTFIKIKPMHLDAGGRYRIRVLYDNLNEQIVSPSSLAARMRERVGHFVDFVDSYPPQLIHFPEDKETFLEEAKMSWEWHTRAVPFLAKDLESDVVIHSIYSPNQMLTSRWWLPFIDKDSPRYGEVDEATRAKLWSEVKDMYRQADALLGEVMRASDANTFVVLSSDHGAIPLAREVRLNNLFESKGWLHHRVNPATGDREIDWENTRVVFLQMTSIYVHSKGLGGPYRRDRSPEYFALRDEVRRAVEALKDPDSGTSIASNIWPHEEAAKAGLPEDRVGDLVVANAPHYLFSEALSDDGRVFVKTLKGGYKQGVWPEHELGMLTPFVIAGPGIKAGCALPGTINHVDQFATLAKLLGLTPPYKLDGRVLDEIFAR